MFTFFRQIIDFIGLLFKLLEMLLGGLIMLLNIIPQGIDMLVRGIAFLPPVVSAFSLAAIMISVTFLIVGRTGKT